MSDMRVVAVMIYSRGDGFTVCVGVNNQKEGDTWSFWYWFVIFINLMRKGTDFTLINTSTLMNKEVFCFRI